MGRKGAIESLSNEELEFVLRTILDGATDRKLSASFEAEFGKRLSKSAIARWRDRAGDELKHTYLGARLQALQLKKDLKKEGVANYELIIENLEDRLLTATQKAVQADPVKVLRISVDEQKRKLKERELDLKESDLALRREKQERDAALKTDRFKVASDMWKFMLAWFLKRNPQVADAMAKDSGELLEEFGRQIEA